jgi:hypothetical protein
MTIIPGQRVHHWKIVDIDSVGKRATAQCQCGQIKIIAIEDLAIRTSCGCKPRPSGLNRAQRAEREQQQRRRQIFDWLPERGR